MIREITSTSNPFIKQLRALTTSKKARQEQGCFLVEGWRAISSLLAYKGKTYLLKQLVISEAWKNDLHLPPELEIVVVPEFIFKKISDVRNAQGILGVVQKIPISFSFAPSAGNYLLLDRLSDPGNIGTLIRSAVGAGFSGVLLYGNCADPFNPKTVRSTMGTFAFIPILSVNQKDLEEMLEAKYALYATTGVGGENIYTTQFGTKNILAIGSEAHGISSELLELSTKKITIPLQPECESLNAAVAGSICLFQIQHS